MRILQTITDDDRRGAQTFACDLGVALSELGEDVETVALTSSTGGHDVECLGPTRRSPRTIAALRNRLDDIDVVVAHGSTTLPVGVLATINTGVPLVYRQISDPYFWAGTRSRRLRVAALLRRTDRVVSLSAHARDALSDHYRLDRGRITIIPNGVPSRKFPPATTEERERRRRELGADHDFVVAFIGALVPEKGADVAIRALRGIHGMRLVVAGDGPERATLQALGADSDVDVTFLGQVDDPTVVLHASDVVVFPSRGGDSMPATIIEAQFTRVPAVATPVGSIGDMIDHGRTGVLVPVDDHRAIADALEMLRDDESARRTIATHARDEAVARFDIDAVAAQWRALLHDVVRARHVIPD